jgi:phosphosulfolactate synthase
MKDVGLQWVEVSQGTVNIPIGKLMDMISLLEEDFNVVAEVGKKRMDEIPEPAHWMNEIDRLLKAGVRYVVLEGRNSADAGIYNPDASLRRELVSSITQRIDSRRLIFEAPTAKSQIQLIRLLGPNVNLGNVLINDLMLLECQRQALRSDTFFHTDATDPSLVLDLAEVAH